MKHSTLQFSMMLLLGLNFCHNCWANGLGEYDDIAYLPDTAEIQFHFDMPTETRDSLWNKMRAKNLTSFYYSYYRSITAKSIIDSTSSTIGWRIPLDGKQDVVCALGVLPLEPGRTYVVTVKEDEERIEFEGEDIRLINEIIEYSTVWRSTAFNGNVQGGTTIEEVKRQHQNHLSKLDSLQKACPKMSEAYITFMRRQIDLHYAACCCELGKGDKSLWQEICPIFKRPEITRSHFFNDAVKDLNSYLESTFSRDFDGYQYFINSKFSSEREVNIWSKILSTLADEGILHPTKTELDTLHQCTAAIDSISLALEDSVTREQWTWATAMPRITANRIRYRLGINTEVMEAHYARLSALYREYQYLLDQGLPIPVAEHNAITQICRLISTNKGLDDEELAQCTSVLKNENLIRSAQLLNEYIKAHKDPNARRPGETSALDFYKQRSMKPIQTDTLRATIPLQQIPIEEDILSSTLDNGLTYYIIPNNESANLADFYLVQRTGSLVEKDGQEGLAHLLEHMMFRGTKHFPQDRQILDFLRQMGVEFGNDLNASTSFENTTYKLRSIPITSEGRIDTCLQILRDWAADALIVDSLVDMERTVVMAELKNYAANPYFGSYYKDMYPDSRYTYRMAIGKAESVSKITGRQIRDFYHKWYQPQLQAVIVVGQIDSTQVKEKIIRLFGDLKRGRTKLPDYSVNPVKHAQPRVIIHKIKDLTNVSIDLLYNNYHSPRDQYRNTTAWYVDNRTLSGIGYLWQKRMSRIMDESISIRSVNFSLHTNEVAGDVPLALNLSISASDWKSGLTTMARELEKTHRYGWTATECADDFWLGKGQFPNIEKWDKRVKKGKITNQNFVNMLVNHFLTGEYVAYGKIGAALSDYYQDNMNAAQAYQRYLQLDNDSCLTIVLNVPDHPAFRVPTEQEVLDLYLKARQGDMEADKYLYAEAPDPGEEVKRIEVLPTPGRIDSILPTSIPFCYELRLSNGIRLFALPSEIAQCSFEGIRPGGLIRTSDEENLMTRCFGAGRRKLFHTNQYWDAHFTPYFLYDNIYCHTYSYPVDYEGAFKMLYLTLTNTELDSVRMSQQIDADRLALEFRQTDHSNDSHLDDILLNSTYRFRSWTTSEYDSIDFSRTNALYHRYMDNFNGTILTLTTNKDIAELAHLIEQYVASLPAKTEPDSIPNWQSLHWRQEPATRIDTCTDDTVNAYCTIIYNQDVDYQYSTFNRVKLQALCNIIEQLLVNEIRVQQGHIYYIGATPSSIRYPYPHQYISFCFKCVPEHLTMIKNAVDDLIDGMLHGNLITQQLLDGYINAKQKEISANTHNTDNPVSKILLPFENGEPDNLDFDKSAVQTLTLDDVRATANLILGKGVRFEYIRMPRE